MRQWINSSHLHVQRVAIMAEETTAAESMSADERRLHELGYAQELLRRMSGFSNFAVSFTIISILSGSRSCPAA
jgi:hypothetical protein